MELGTTNRNVSDQTEPKFPGCFFHASILGESKIEGDLFPKSLSVPRFPSIFFTPVGVMEFVLGELFQQEWVRPGRYAAAPLTNNSPPYSAVGFSLF